MKPVCSWLFSLCYATSLFISPQLAVQPALQRATPQLAGASTGLRIGRRASDACCMRGSDLEEERAGPNETRDYRSSPIVVMNKCNFGGSTNCRRNFVRQNI